MRAVSRGLIGLAILAFFGAAHGQSLPEKLSPDLREVVNYKAFRKALRFNPAQIAALRKNFFFTCPSDTTELQDVYGENDYRNLSSFVSADNVLQLFHAFFDASLRDVEAKRLIPELRMLNKEMLSLSVTDYQRLKSTSLGSAAQTNVAYFEVANWLLGDRSKLAAGTQTTVKAELSRVAQASEMDDSPIFGERVDYSQFKIRGHYTRSKALGRYFQCMMWYGLVPFAEPKGDSDNYKAWRPIQQSLLLARNLATPSALRKWQSIYDATSMYAGKANNLTPPQWNAIATTVFGADSSSFKDLGKLQQFVAKCKSTFSPKIVRKFEPEVQLRFMGQRSVADSRILQSLTNDVKHPEPSPLDVMSVLGCPRATEILDVRPDLYNPEGWVDYLPTRKELTGQFSALPASQWSEDLYWSWLDLLRIEARPDLQETGMSQKANSLPRFMRSTAWQDHSLSTALGAWAELRHDTILYAVQPSAAEGGDEEVTPPPVLGYVEPNVALYRRLQEVLLLVKADLKKQNDLGDLERARLSSFHHLLEFLLDVSEKELAHKRLTRDEHDRIRHIESDLSDLAVMIEQNPADISGSSFQEVSADDQDMATVADFHTHKDEALFAAVGHPDDIFVVAPIDGKLYLTRGSTFSYYEFKRPISDRLTDHEWKEQLRAGHAPPRPWWIKSFHLSKPVPEARE